MNQYFMYSSLMAAQEYITHCEFWKALASELLKQEEYEASTTMSKRCKEMTESPGLQLQAIPLYSSLDIKSQAFKQTSLRKPDMCSSGV